MKKKHFSLIPDFYRYWESKIGLKMRATLIVLLICIGQTFAVDLYSQNKRLSLNMSNVPIKSVLEAIEDQSEFFFMYEAHNVDVEKKVNVSAENKTVPEILNDIFANTDITYKINNRQIALTAKSLSSVGQQILKVSGKVTDSDGVSLPGVSIVVKGTTNGTITDANGSYSLPNVPENATLQFSFVGMKSQEVLVEGKATINVTLSGETIGIDEVVAIGYGTVKKSDITGSVFSLRSEDLNKGMNSSVNQMLQGRASGLTVYQNSSEPGGGMNLQIRGVGSINAGNEPLYVIDGLPIDNSPTIIGVGNGFTASRNPRNPLNSLNPNDIQSIEVLKDASATAIYGSRGANGVVMITTKNGQKGKMKVKYDAYYGVQRVDKMLDMMNAQEYKMVLNELYDAGAVNAGVGERVEDISGNGTNWQNEVIRDAPVQSHNLSFSGGENNTKYFASLSYFDQDGVVISSGIKRYSTRLNLETNIPDKFKFGVNFNTSFIYDDFVPEGIVPNEEAGVISSAIDFDPTLPIFDETGRYAISPFISKDNPLAVAYGKDAIAKTFRTFGTIYGEYFVIPEFSVKLNLGGDISSSKRDVFVDSRTKRGYDAGGMGTVIMGILYNYLAELTFNYNKKINDDHSLNIMAGATTQKFFTERINASAMGFISEATGTNSLQSGTQTTFDINTSKIPSSLISFLGRANYSFKDKILLTGTIRADGSSRFGENNKFAYFPSTAVAWKLNNEKFIKDLALFSTLKLRASWGQTGNQDIGNFRSLTTFSPGGVMIYGDTQYIVMQPSRMPNPELKWETTTQTDLGIDFSILDSRISGSLDYFYKKTTDLLLDIPVPPQTGFNTKLANVGSVQNNGWEFNLNSRNFTGKFKWSTNFNLSLLKNKVLDLGNLNQIIMGNLQFTTDISTIRPGEPMNSYFGYEIRGVWQEGDDFTLSKQNPKPGDWKYKDQLTVDTDNDGIADTADGLITADDRVILGSPIPDFTWGMTNDLSFRNFNLSFNIIGIHGVQLLNNQLAESFYPINFRRNKLAEPYLNRWKPGNPTNDYPSFINPSSQGGNKVNSRTVENASYLRLQSVSLSYDIPVEKGKVFSSFNVFATGTNLLTLTNYSGMDPGANVNGTAAAALRIDYNSYPLAKTIMLGVNVGF